MISFRVIGEPQTQGSKRAFAKNGRAWVVETGGAKHKSWREAVASEARAALGGAPLLTGPLEITLVFALPRPASAPKRRRTWPIGARSGDVDKLARAVLDAITGTIARDDAQVIGLEVSKDYGDPPGVTVLIEEVKDDG